MVWVLCVRAVVVRVSVGLLGLDRSFFIIGGIDRLCLRLRGVLLWSIVELPLTAPFLPILHGASPFHQLRRVEEY